MIVSSCALPIEVKLEVLHPGTIINDSTIYSVQLAISNTAADDTLFLHPHEDNYRYDSTAAMACIEGFSAGLSDSPRFLLLNPDQPIVINPQQPNTQDTLAPADGIIILNGFGCYEVSAGLTKPYYYYSLSRAYNKSEWIMFNTATDQSLPLLTYSDSTTIETESAFAEELKYYHPTEDELRNGFAWESGFSVAQQIAPFWQDTVRIMANALHSEMKKATELAQRGLWREAAALWQPLTHSRRSHLAAKACNNMAIAAETEGRTLIALRWIEQAIKLHAKAEYISYRSSIKRVLITQPQLNKQMNYKPLK